MTKVQWVCGSCSVPALGPPTSVELRAFNQLLPFGGPSNNIRTCVQYVLKKKLAKYERLENQVKWGWKIQIYTVFYEIHNNKQELTKDF